jgi:hypothetical protein
MGFFACEKYGFDGICRCDWGCLMKKIEIPSEHDILKWLVRESKLNAAILVTIDKEDQPFMLAVAQKDVYDTITPQVIIEIQKIIWNEIEFPCENKLPL